MPLSADETRKLVSAYYATVSSGEVDAICALFTADADMRDPVGVAVQADDAARRETYGRIGAAFATFSIKEQRIVTNGGEAAASWTAQGTMQNGRDVEFGGMSAFAFDDAGLITRMWAFWEPAALAAAMA